MTIDMNFCKKNNKLFIQGVDQLDKEENPIGKIRCMLKNYLELDNVNFLFGTGSSIIIGARSIQSIPLAIEETIQTEGVQDKILAQLPILPQQHAIIMGDAVRTPVQVRLNNANPKPDSENPKFIEKWLIESDKDIPNYKAITKNWEGMVNTTEEQS